MEIKNFTVGLPPANCCRAFVPNRIPKIDYRPLDEYADSVIFMDFEPVQPGETCERIMRDIDSFLKMKDFRAAMDYLVVGASDPVALAAIVFCIAKGLSEVTLLRYDRLLGGYWPLKITF
jgi:hypothetical protein